MARQKAYPWEGKIVHHSAVGGIETSVTDDGPGRGNRVAWVNTGSGLRFKVVIDRGLDIVDAFYNEHSLAWLSHGGITGPQPHANSGIEWLYSFAGGLVTTCGLTHVGGPNEDAPMNRGLHDRVSNLRGAVESIIQPDPVEGRLEMSIMGVVKHSMVFGPNLEMRAHDCVHLRLAGDPDSRRGDQSREFALSAHAAVPLQLRVAAGG